MLYIASALDSTAVTHSVFIPDFIPTSAPSSSASTTSTSTSALVVAKGNVIEVWDVRPEGLVEVARTEVWGIVVGLEWVVKEGRQPHIVVLTDHPLSRLLMYRYTNSGPTTSSSLQLTASTSISLLSRTAEFYTSLVADRAHGIAYASLYTGLLSVIQIDDWEPEIVTARRRTSAAGASKTGTSKAIGKRKESVTGTRQGLGASTTTTTGNGTGTDTATSEELEMRGALAFREQYEITIQEHNLLSLAVIPYHSKSPMRSSGSGGNGAGSSTLAFLYLTPDYTVNLVARTLDITTKMFVDLCLPIDVLSPPSSSSTTSGSASFNDFSVPAAKRLLALPDGGVVVIGDEFSAKYTLGMSRNRSLSASSSGAGTGGGILSTSPNSRMSPEMTKKRKSSQGGATFTSPATLTSTPSRQDQAEKGTVSWQKSWRVRQGFGDITACIAISAGPSSVAILGDSFGRLTMISSPNSGGKVAQVQFLGSTSPPATISHIEGLIFFIGSECGDSQVVQLRPGGSDSSRPSLPLPSPSAVGKGKNKGKSKGKAKESADMMQVVDEDEELETGTMATTFGLDVLQSWNNLGPIRDFCLVQERDASGSYIITASGFNSTGSLRIVRSGVGTEELLKIEGVQGVQNIFPVEVEVNGQSSSLVVLSTAFASFALRLASDPHSEDIIVEDLAISWPGFVSDQVTLCTSKISSSSVVQVTPFRIVVTNISSGAVELDWNDLGQGEEIVLADVKEGNVLLALNGGGVIHLALEGTSSLQVSRNRMDLSAETSEEISALDIVSLASTCYAAIGFWGSNAIELYTIPSLKHLHQISIEPSLPRSIRSKTSADRLQILVGRGDGRTSTYLIPLSALDGTSKWSTKSTGEIALGQLPVTLTPVYRGENRGELVKGAMLGISDKVSLIYESNGRTSYSSFGGKGIVSASLSRLPGHGDCILTASRDTLSIHRVSSVKSLHIRKVDLGGDVPVGIAHDSHADVLGVASIRTTIDQQYGDEYTESNFRLYDDSTMVVSAELILDPGENPTTLQAVTIHGHHYFCLGSVFANDPDDSGGASRGKLRVLEAVNPHPGSQTSIQVVTTHETKGPVLDCKAIWNHLAICVDHQVDLLKFEDDKSLSSVSSWGSCFIASCLSVQRLQDPSGEWKERLHVGDGMRSVFALDLIDGTQLMDVGRDMKPHWVVSMEELEADGGAVAIADTSYNILTIRHMGNILENAAAFALHETVTRFKRGALVPQATDSAIAKPELIFATSSGRIGIIADIGENESSILNELQRNMDSMVHGPKMDWRRYREIHTEGNARPRPTVGFIDGDFLKTFLDRSIDFEWATSIINGPSEFSKVGAGTSGGEPTPLEDVIRVVESVARLH